MRSLTRSALIVASLALSANTTSAAAAGAHKVVWPDVDPSNVTTFAGAARSAPGRFVRLCLRRNGAWRGGCVVLVAQLRRQRPDRQQRRPGRAAGD